MWKTKIVGIEAKVKSSMTVSALIIALLIFSGSSAFAWTKVFDCKGSNVVIDRKTPFADAVHFQIVFRDQTMIEQLLESGAVDIKRLTSLSEIVLMLRQNEMRSREWIGEADSFLPAGVVYFVRPENGTLVFEAFRTTQSTPESYIVLDKIGAWPLRECHGSPSLYHP